MQALRRCAFARRRPADSNYNRRRSRFTFVNAFVTTGIQTVMARLDPAIHTYAAPPTPMEASEIFTPGPMDEEMETFFI